jgi:hypothetical protein
MTITRVFNVGRCAFLAVAMSILVVSSAVQAQDSKESLRDKLAEKVNFDGIDAGTSLREAIGFIKAVYGVKIEVDAEAFTKAKNGKVLERTVKLPAMKNVVLATVIETMARQVDGTATLQKDQVLFVPRKK